MKSGPSLTGLSQVFRQRARTLEPASAHAQGQPNADLEAAMANMDQASLQAVMLAVTNAQARLRQVGVCIPQAFLPNRRMQATITLHATKLALRRAFCGRARALFWPSVTFINPHFAVCQAPASSATAVTNVSAPHVDSSEANSSQSQPSASDSGDDDDLPALVASDSDDDDDNDFVHVSSDQSDPESHSDPSSGVSSLACTVEVGSSPLCSRCCRRACQLIAAFVDGHNALPDALQVRLHPCNPVTAAILPMML